MNVAVAPAQRSQRPGAKSAALIRAGRGGRRGGGVLRKPEEQQEGSFLRSAAHQLSDFLFHRASRLHARRPVEEGAAVGRRSNPPHFKGGRAWAAERSDANPVQENILPEPAACGITRSLRRLHGETVSFAQPYRGSFAILAFLQD